MKEYSATERKDFRLSYKIDNTLLKICEERKIDIKVLIKNTTQFIGILDKFIDTDIKNVLKYIQENHTPNTIKKLELNYQDIKVKTTIYQKSIYYKIAPQDRKEILNELLSIAINNTYFNFEEENENEKLENKRSIFISRYSLSFLLDKKHKESNISCLETIIRKLKKVLEDKAIVRGFYNKLGKEIFNYYNVESTNLKVFDSYTTSVFLLSQFEKFYFILNLEYNMPLGAKNKYLISYKSKYEKILISKYKNNISLFIEKEIKFIENVSEKEEKYAWYKYLNELIVQDPEIIINENLDMIFTVDSAIRYNSFLKEQKIDIPVYFII